MTIKPPHRSQHIFNPLSSCFLHPKTPTCSTDHFGFEKGRIASLHVIYVKMRAITGTAGIQPGKIGHTVEHRRLEICLQKAMRLNYLAT